MKEFQRKKDTSLLLFNSVPLKNNTIVDSDQSKNLYDFALKHEGQIKRLESEITNIKAQLIELSTKFSLNLQNNNIEENINSSYLGQIMSLKEDIKNDLMKDINNIMISQYNEFKEKFENLKDKIELYNDERYNSNRIIEISDNIENINKQLFIKGNEKKNLQNIIINKINNDKNEINNKTDKMLKRIDIIDLDFDRLVQSLKTQFLNNANTISKMDISKVNVNDYEKQINLINNNIEELKIKINNINVQYRNNLINKNLKLNNNDNINSLDNGIKNQLILFKNEIYNDLEKINLKILNELKNQADDIKIIYKKMNNEENINNIKDKNRDINFDTPKNLSVQSLNLLDQNDNIMSIMESELSKKANLDQLNFALETQAKLNEAFSSASRICRFCWDTEGVLKDNKFIIWTIQNINTALDVFKWENNSENITILQNGVYRIVIGLIGVEKNKNFGIIFNDDKNIIVSESIINNNNIYGFNDIDNDNNISKDKGNVLFMEKYIACIENTKIKAIIFNKNNNNDYNDDNSEEAFLEIIKII